MHTPSAGCADCAQQRGRERKQAVCMEGGRLNWGVIRSKKKCQPAYWCHSLSTPNALGAKDGLHSCRLGLV